MSNAGATKLASLGLSCAEVVERLKAAGFATSRISVSRWQNGKTKPEAEARTYIERAFGIESTVWDGGAPPKPAPSAPATIPAPPAVPTSTDPTASELARDLLTRIQLYREQFETTNLGVQGRKALAEMEGKAIERYAKLSGQAATEREILSSPHFTKILDDIFAVLEKHPDAMLALRAALSGAEAA